MLDSTEHELYNVDKCLIANYYILLINVKCQQLRMFGIVTIVSVISTTSEFLKERKIGAWITHRGCSIKRFLGFLV